MEGIFRYAKISPVGIGIVKMEIKTCRNPFLLDPRPVGICLKLTLHTQMRKIFGTSHYTLYKDSDNNPLVKTFRCKQDCGIVIYLSKYNDMEQKSHEHHKSLSILFTVKMMLPLPLDKVFN